MFLVRFNKIRYRSQILHFSVSSSPFSVKTCYLLNSDDKKPTENNMNINEHHVLDQLSVLLPIRHHSTPSIEEPSSESSQLNQNLEMLLSPEDKLRGIFIQKLNGKTAIKRALTVAAVDLEVSSDLVAKVLNRGSLSGQAMVTLFEWAIEHGKVFEDVDSYNVVLRALGRRKFFNYMINVLSEMRAKGLNPNYETLFIFMDSFVKARRVSKALHMFGKLEEFGMEYDLESLKLMLRCLCMRSFVATASSLLNKMKEKVPFDSETYNIVIRGWSKFGRDSEIERVLKEMVADGFEPDNFTFSHLLEGLGRAGRIDDAVQIFENLKEQKRCVLNAAIFNAMIFNFIAVGNIDECLKYYDAMLSNNCEPNMDTYVSIISAFLKVRRVADAIEMFDEMIGRGIIPATGTVTSFIESLCGYGPPHAAMMIYKKAKDVGCTVSLSAYKILLMRLSRFGKCGMLLTIWDEMERGGYFSDVEVYEYIINGLCNNGQLENAVVIMEDCLKKGFCPSRLICAKLNNKLLASNKVEMAYKLFLKIKKGRCEENARKYWRSKGWHF
ncbi:putative pentatricopeptide repeat-containing protein At5g43820 [Cynara cardunculus var. scolymus]|uniref:Pentatricopeptide repeat-containing protein n=1 Tax=Cynara cardunculus var. scolymus TaxID=59895 RepID=A0A103XQA9_CYNCS|nr:putative pentatricopeptide repeat-containing protein At5g43820 [Cynara cardunculus var. scolymus]KVH94814.1 Pentatricopeptide repeat-containing protein [Cynara cardunculus var. scolymus]